jgi:hypothetical protein
MRKKCSRILRLAVLLTILAGLFLPAHAQLGVGIGGWGDHIFSWVEIWPRWSGGYRAAPYRSDRLTANPPAQTNGFLEGNVQVLPSCPVSQPSAAQTPASQIQPACPLLPTDAVGNLAEAVIITATPYGGNQGFVTQPTNLGYYRMMLPPGGYVVGIRHPYQGHNPPDTRSIIIQSGQTMRLDARINAPIQ